MDPVRTKLTVLVAAIVAFALGLWTASGLEWTRGAAAAGGSATASQAPAKRDVAPIDDLSRGFVSIARAVTPAVVSVRAEGAPPRPGFRFRLPPGVPEPFEEWFRRFYRAPSPDQEIPWDVPLGTGSGFIVSEDGYIVTNNHVVERAEKITVELSDGRQLEARLIGRDPTTDVAVVKVDARGLPTLALGNSDQVQIGEWVLAVGNPGFGDGNTLDFTVTAGIVSAKGRNINIIQRSSGSSYAIEDFIQTDAVINPGNSGGPLVNTRGEAIGMNTAIASPTGYYQGYGFAIPINLVKTVMKDLIEYGRVRRAALGISIRRVTPEDAEAFRLPEVSGVVVQDFTENSPARAAGLERGDVIVEVDGEKIQRVGQLQQLIAAHKPGDVVEVKAIRYGEPKTFRVRLTEAPVPEPEPEPRVASARPSTRLGFEVAPLTPEAAREAGYPENAKFQGVIVRQVEEYSPAARAGFQPGMVIERVNRKPIRSPEDLQKALEDLKPGEVVSFDIALPSADEPDGFSRLILNVRVPK
jgi:serine protease Do